MMVLNIKTQEGTDTGKSLDGDMTQPIIHFAYFAAIHILVIRKIEMKMGHGPCQCMRQNVNLIIAQCVARKCWRSYNENFRND